MRAFSDVFACGLISIATTGLCIARGRYGLLGRGKWLVGAGLIFPLATLVALQRPALLARHLQKKRKINNFMKAINGLQEQRRASFVPTRVRWHPDAKRAHGAWIYLFLAIGAGALVGPDSRVEPAMLAGTGFAGAFLVVAAIDAGPQRKIRQLLLGAGLAILTPLIALWLGAPPVFLKVAALAILPAMCVVILARTSGTLSPTTLIVGVAALTLSAPVAATAGGASIARAAAIFGLLWPFFSWQSIRVNTSLPKGIAWDRSTLRARGLREAATAAVWTLAVAIGLRIL